MLNFRVSSYYSINCFGDTVTSISRLLYPGPAKLHIKAFQACRPIKYNRRQVITQICPKILNLLVLSFPQCGVFRRTQVISVYPSCYCIVLAYLYQDEYTFLLPGFITLLANCIREELQSKLTNQSAYSLCTLQYHIQ